MAKVKWDKSVHRAKTIANRDGIISHPDVINILRSTLDHGAITVTERDNLERIARSASNPRSKKLIRMITAAHLSLASFSKLKLQPIATNRVFDFLKKSEPGKFRHFDRDEIGVDIIKRIADPGLIRQGTASLCGPSALLFSLAMHNPTRYVNFATDLFDKGTAKMGKLVIRPGSDCRNYKPPTGKIAPVDWMTAASLRDSENWFFDYDSVKKEFAGITLPDELASWFKKAGFRNVKEVTNVYFNKGRGTLDDVKRLHQRGYRICLFIGANMLDARKQTKGTTTADHWVVLTDLISTTGNVKLDVFTWGHGHFKVPSGSAALSESDFYSNFYGYVASKP